MDPDVRKGGSEARLENPRNPDVKGRGGGNAKETVKCILRLLSHQQFLLRFSAGRCSHQSRSL